MSSLSTRSNGRRRIAAIAVAAVALGGFVAYGQSPASAHETSVDLVMTCVSGTVKIPDPLKVHYVVNHAPDTAVAGEALEITTTSTVSGVTLAVDVTGLKITIPTPAGVTSGGQIKATGGNGAKSGQTSNGDSTTVEFPANPPVKSTELQVPTLGIPVLISENHPETITFEGPSNIELTIPALPLPVDCTPSPDNPPLLQIKP